MLILKMCTDPMTIYFSYCSYSTYMIVANSMFCQKENLSMKFALLSSKMHIRIENSRYIESAANMNAHVRQTLIWNPINSQRKFPILRKNADWFGIMSIMKAQYQKFRLAGFKWDLLNQHSKNGEHFVLGNNFKLMHWFIFVSDSIPNTCIQVNINTS